MTKHKLTRVCSICGIEKPLSAFLEISAQGTRYGVICSSCRAAEKGKKEAKPEEDIVTLPGGARIGGKEKVFIAKEQKRQIKDLKDLFKKESQRREEVAEKKLTEEELKEKG